MILESTLTFEKGHIFKPSEHFHTIYNPKGHLELLSRQMNLQMILSHRQLCNLKSLLPRKLSIITNPFLWPYKTQRQPVLEAFLILHFEPQRIIIQKHFPEMSLLTVLCVIPWCPPFLTVSLTKEINCFSNSLFSKVLVITQKNKTKQKRESAI